MNRSTAGTPSHRHPAVLVTAALLASLLSATAANGQALGDLQAKMAALKQSTAENQQKLHHYRWLETTQLTLKGEAKPATQAMCQYGPDGKVEKAPMSPQRQEAPSGGRFKQRIIAKKKEEMKDYMGQVKILLAMYVPPDAQRMQQAFQEGKVSINPSPDSGIAKIVFKDYAQPGDQMTISFDTSDKKISALNVNTYMDEPKDVVTLAVRFASLPDNTNYVERSVLDATAKKLQVTTTNSGYEPIGQ
ncbi:hypothetical protein RBB79_16265 [Tunturiibacter empetritectus]|uniref:Outer membrane lipoprotein carrier protein LolA n=2 Tax=Tunturiibacter TaxID=3154218 RepID=A0A852VJ09_9BACT|nr:hypothetical protein [Edaphobacter lichenicola]NYF91171.1 hypothetical protein [Edaphobacter lichenicola]